MSRYGIIIEKIKCIEIYREDNMDRLMCLDIFLYIGEDLADT